MLRMQAKHHCDPDICVHLLQSNGFPLGTVPVTLSRFTPTNFLMAFPHQSSLPFRIITRLQSYFSVRCSRDLLFVARKTLLRLRRRKAVRLRSPRKGAACRSKRDGKICCFHIYDFSCYLFAVAAPSLKKGSSRYKLY